MNLKVADRLGAVEEYYFSKKLKEIRSLNADGADIINLGIGSPDLPPHPRVVNALVDAANQSSTHGYQSYLGIPELRKAFGAWHQRFYGVTLNPEKEILPLIGSKEGIMHISMTYLEEGDEVLVPNPGYPAYAAAAKIAGATIKYYDLNESNDWQPDFDQLAQADLSKVKIMWVNYPHMPSGKPASRALFERLIAFGKEHSILIINDNPYSFILNDQPLSLMSVDGAMDTAMELNSLSKAQNMAGWRVGTLVGDAQRIQEVLRFKSNMDSGMFKGIQMAAAEALKLDEAWYASLNSTYEERRQIAFRIMDDLDCTYATDHHGLFVWGRIPSDVKDAYTLSDKCLYEANVFITPGGIFGSNGDNYIRISLCAPVETLAKAQARIIKHLSHQTKVLS